MIQRLCSCAAGGAIRAGSAMVASALVVAPSILARESLQCRIFSFSSTTSMRCASLRDRMYNTCRVGARQPVLVRHCVDCSLPTDCRAQA